MPEISDNQARSNLFELEVEKVINSNSLENISGTPDYILAEFVRRCFDAVNKAIEQRDKHKEIGEYAVQPQNFFTQEQLDKAIKDAFFASRELGGDIIGKIEYYDGDHGYMQSAKYPTILSYMESLKEK